MLWKIAVLFLAALVAVGFCDTPGGSVDINPNDKDFQMALNFAVSLYNHNSNSLYRYKVIQVIRAQSQVVEGINYIMEVKLAKTVCLKNSWHHRYCPIDTNSANAHMYTCKFVVWSRPWLDDIRLTEKTCV